MNRRRAASLLLCSLLAACSADPSSVPATRTPTATPNPTPTITSSVPSPSPQPSETPAPSPQPSEAAIGACGDVLAATVPKGSFTRSLGVFDSADGLSLYEVEADSVTVLAPATSQFGPMPRFRTPGLVSFVRQREPGDDEHLSGQDSLFEFDLQSGQAAEILRLPSDLLAYDWSPDGTLLAYHLQGWSSPEPRVSLCLFDTRTGTTRLLRSLPEWIGRGPNQRDEVSVAWSPDADQILSVDTIGHPTIFVVDLDGRDVITPQRGTFARWLSNRRILLQQDQQNTQLPWGWVSMATATGQVRPFDLPSAAYRPALSPNGRIVAFDDGDGGRPSIWVFDRDRGTTRKVGRSAVAPVWLGPGRIAATVAVPCPPTYFCVTPWLSSDETIGIDVLTGESRPLALGTTSQGWATGTLDVLLARS